MDIDRRTLLCGLAGLAAGTAVSGMAAPVRAAEAPKAPAGGKPMYSTMTPSQRINPLATHGMVTSPHYLASQAGLDILRRGGNAVDAAIAVASTLAVVYPQMCTLGGDTFWLVYDAKAKKLHGLNASGRAGSKATIENYTSKGLSKIPSRGYLAANTVPGVVSGWGAAYAYSKEKMATRCDWKEIFDAAIELAGNGCPVSTSLADWSRIDLDPANPNYINPANFTGFAKAFLKEGEPYALGDILRQPDLAKSLALIARNGAAEFYEGSIAEKIVADLEKHGGVLTMDDFRKHKANWVEPATTMYRGYTACNMPPNTQGMASLGILNILNNFDVKGLGEGTADYIHLVVEATRQAFADRDRWLTDPEFVKIPVAEILSAAHGRRQAARIDMAKAAGDVKPMDPKGDTVWFGVVDGKGNACSVIQSIYFDFGSGIVPEGTGIILQNRGCFFSLDPNHINCLKPGKRTFHTLNPAMLLKDGRPALVYGTMGGEGQPQTQAAVATRVIDFGMTPQEAIDAPRWLYGRTWGSETNGLRIEGRFAPGVAEELGRRGHAVSVVAPYTDTMGHAGAIKIDDNGLLQGGTDPRGDGLACGY